MEKMVDTLNSHVEMLREEKNLNNMLRNTIEIMKDDKKTKIKEFENILANVDKSIPVYNDYGDKKYTSQIILKWVHKGPALVDLLLSLLTTSRQHHQSDNSPSVESQLKNYEKAKGEKYAEHVVKCKAEALNAPDGSKERKDHGNKRKTSKENNIKNDHDNRQSKDKPEIVNNNARNSQSSLRQYRNSEQQQQQ